MNSDNLWEPVPSSQLQYQSTGSRSGVPDSHGWVPEGIMIISKQCGEDGSGEIEVF
jgi:hypothetical protein